MVENPGCQTRVCSPKWIIILTLLALVISTLPELAPAEESNRFFFIQLTDPQFGMYANNANFEQETINFEFAIATTNRLKPAFVVVTGDLINKPGDPAQINEYLRIAAKLDRSIPLYNVAGNHDVGNKPTPESIAAYTAKFGPDHYSFRSGNLVGIVLNTMLIQTPKEVAKLAAEQELWLKAELEKAKQAKTRHIVIFQHHPWFIKDIQEPNTYENLPVEIRSRYLDLFQQQGVTHIFAGHSHNNHIVRHGNLEIVVSGAIGQPLRKSKSGLRVVIVHDGGIEHRYYEMSEIPNRIVLSPPKKPSKP